MADEELATHAILEAILEIHGFERIYAWWMVHIYVTLLRL